MSLLDMRLFGDPILREVAEPFTEQQIGLESTESLVKNMLDTMDDQGGVGLAANQVGIAKRVFVYDCEGDRGYVLNPTWEPVGDEQQVGTEGCLSIPKIYGTVTRYNTVSLRGTQLDGTTVEREVSGLLARCVQHETDHLNGVLFLQHLPQDERRDAMAQIRQSEWF